MEMPLDPVLRKTLDTMPDMNNFDYNSINIKEYRKTEAYESRKTRPDAPNAETQDFVIGVEGGEIGARLYSTENSSDALIVFFHGGGFVFGSIDSYDYICRTMAHYSGCRILSVGYRLAPEHKFPTAVNDAFAAYMWAREHSSELKANSNRIAVSGDSAGGNLAAAVTLMCKDTGKPMPQLQLLFYPVIGYDTTSFSQSEYSGGYNLDNPYTKWFTEKYIRGKADLIHPYYSILSHDNLSGMPETIVFTAEYDTLRDPAETLVYRLREAGTEATGIRALGMFHAFVSHISTSNAARNFFRMACGLASQKLMK